MTLLVALRGLDGLVLAADSRGTFGDPSQTTAQNDSMQKAHVLSKHAAILAAGASEVGALLIAEAQAVIAAQKIDGATNVMEAVRQTARAKYNEWFPTVPPIQPPQLAMAGGVATRPGVQFIVAGYELDESGAPGATATYQIGSWTDFAPSLHDYGFAVAGVAQYALYLLNRLYQPDRSVEELTALAVYVITETASQDGKVGGPVKVITCTADTGCVALDDAVVVKIAAGNEERSASLRDSFYQGATDAES
jgi:20S proteasome alpha/beta subunit